MRELPSDETIRKLIESHVSSYISFSIVNMQYTNFDTLEVIFSVKNENNRLFAVYFNKKEIENEPIQD
jgi:hypothetical protein